jgi:hypothetical protein
MVGQSAASPQQNLRQPSLANRTNAVTCFFV